MNKTLKSILRPVKHKVFGKDGIYKAMDEVGFASQIIDVGSANGDYADKFLKAFPTARILAFEPNPRSNFGYPWDLQNRITLKKFGLSNEKAKRALYYNSDSPDGASFYEHAGCNKVRYVEVYPLDDVAYDGYGKSIDLLKIDAEGHELAVLEGAVKTLPNVYNAYIEISRNEWKVLKLMEEAGFKLLWVSDWNNYFFKRI